MVPEPSDGPPPPQDEEAGLGALADAVPPPVAVSVASPAEARPADATKAAVNEAAADEPLAIMPVQWRSERVDSQDDRARRAPATPTATEAALPRRSAPDPTPAPVTLSIERIDVEFVHPPAPPAVTTSAVSRTRGFSNYDRARRGSPR
jgi:hypothetical protein